MKNHRIFKVKFLPVTEHRGDRIKISEKRMGITKSVVLPWNYKYNHVKDYAFDYLQNKGIEVVGYGENGSDWFLFSNSWADKTNENFIEIK